MAVTELGAYDNGACEGCGKRFSRGGGALSYDGATRLSLCRWCLAMWLEAVTGFKVFDQLVDWETKKQARRHTRWNGWTSAPPRDPWTGLRCEHDIPVADHCGECLPSASPTEP